MLLYHEIKKGWKMGRILSKSGFCLNGKCQNNQQIIEKVNIICYNFFILGESNW